MSSVVDTDKLDLHFVSLSNIFTEIRNLKKGEKNNMRSPAQKWAVFVFTKDNLPRIRKTLPQLINKPISVILLDDSTSETVKQFVKAKCSNTNIMYHGLKEQLKVLEHIKSVGGQARWFISYLGEPDWTLGYCRNYAILLAKIYGFDKIIMMDDDITVNSFEHLINTFKLLSQFGIVGAKTTGIPDDSVVGHILRMCGIEQYDFISGQFVGIDINSVYYYFPNVYNEDWIFFLLQSTKVSLARYAIVKQLMYDPFDKAVQKSVFQEFGEVLCEGVIEAVVNRNNVALLTNQQFWSTIFSARMGLLSKLRSVLSFLPKREMTQKILKALAVYHSSIHPEQFCCFFEKYFEQVPIWLNILKDASIHNLKQLFASHDN